MLKGEVLHVAVDALQLAEDGQEDVQDIPCSPRSGRGISRPPGEESCNVTFADEDDYINMTMFTLTCLAFMMAWVHCSAIRIEDGIERQEVF